MTTSRPSMQRSTGSAARAMAHEALRAQAEARTGGADAWLRALGWDPRARSGRSGTRRSRRRTPARRPSTLVNDALRHARRPSSARRWRHRRRPPSPGDDPLGEALARGSRRSSRRSPKATRRDSGSAPTTPVAGCSRTRRAAAAAAGATCSRAATAPRCAGTARGSKGRPRRRPRGRRPATGRRPEAQPCSSSGLTSVAKRVIDSSSYGAGHPGDQVPVAELDVRRELLRDVLGRADRLVLQWRATRLRSNASRNSRSASARSSRMTTVPMPVVRSISAGSRPTVSQCGRRTCLLVPQHSIVPPTLFMSPYFATSLSVTFSPPPPMQIGRCAGAAPGGCASLGVVVRRRGAVGSVAVEHAAHDRQRLAQPAQPLREA